MKQVSQRPRAGKIAVSDVPAPQLPSGWILVANQFSLISAGTERQKLELGGKSLLAKARSRPDLVRKVKDRARVEGLRAAASIARDRLNALAPLGYSSAGVVIEVGSGVAELAPGDRVACGGAGWANHASVVAVPRRLTAPVPSGVDLADATYATVGAIALHAVRQAEVQLGEHVGVIGLGLVGQLVVRLLNAAGCRPIGIDIDPVASELASATGVATFGPDEARLESHVTAATDGHGLDAVLVCASTNSSGPMDLATRLARDRGSVVVVGNVPIAADWKGWYEKELELRLSRSYGPGRYDREYEEYGHDLPVGYVRWTEQRNLQAFLELVANGSVRPAELTTHRFRVDQADEAYAVLANPPDGTRAFGVLLEYPDNQDVVHARAASPAQGRRKRKVADSPRIGLVGAGAFARSVLLPALTANGARLRTVASERGLTAADVAGRFGFERTAGSIEEVLADDQVDAVVIATRHASHSALTAAALRAGKPVFVEKPLALTWEGLLEVEHALDDTSILMVGFNRRFAPMTEAMGRELDGLSDRVFLARINAGPLPPEHWMHDPLDGGGRLLGEGCHFVDLLGHLAGSAPVSAQALVAPQPGRPLECSDTLAATLRFADGTIGSLVYSGAGDQRLGKERIEGFGGGTSVVIDDFRKLEVYRGGKRRVDKQRQDKGHRAQIERFLAAVTGRDSAPPVESYLASSRTTLALVDSLRSGLPVEL